MIRRILLVLGILSLFTVDADACNRCGRFRGCKYCYNQAVAVTPVVYQQPSVFVVQNNIPAPSALLAQQGNTLYGYQQAASAYYVNPAEVIRQAAELSRAATATASIGLAGFNQTAQQQLALQAAISEPLAKGQAAAQVLSAAGLSQPSAFTQQQSFALEIYQSNGRWQVKQADPQQVNAQAQSEIVPQAPPEQPPSTSSVLALKCAKCHGLTLAEPKGGVFLDAAHKIDFKLFNKSVRLISEDKMPKGGPPLTPQEKGLALQELLDLSKEGDTQ